MMLSLKSKSALVIFMLLQLQVSGCRKPDSPAVKRAEMHSKLLSGRHMQVPVTQSDSGLFLTSGPVFKQESGPDGTYLTRVLFDTSKMEPVATGSVAEWQKKWVTENSAALGLVWSDLEKAPAFYQSPGGTLHVWQYLRRKSGLLVRDAFLKFFMVPDPEGNLKLSEVRNHTFSGAQIINAGSSDAGPAGLNQLTGYESLTVQSFRNLLIPRLSSEGKEILLRAREFQALDNRTGETLTISVASGSGEILEAYSNRISAKHSFIARTWKNSPLDPQKSDFPLAFLNVPGSALFTDGDGNADLPPTADVQSVTLNGMRAGVFNGAGTTTPAEASPISLTGQIQENTTVFDALDNAAISGLMTWTALQRINRLVRNHLTPQEASILNSPLPAYVNVDTIGTCNAFYTSGPTNYMVFYESGDGCANTATLADVVAHEWCHGLDDKTGQPGIFDAAFSEGIGDLCAAFLSDSPEMAKGFFLANPSVPMRTLKNNLRFPDDQSTDPHAEGLIIAGAIWDLKEALELKYGVSMGSFTIQRLFFHALITTESYQNMHDAILRLNDDDNNPATPAPDYCEINKAFSGHGLATLDNILCPAQPEPAESFGNFKPDNTIYLGFESSTTTPGTIQWIVSAQKGATAKICLAPASECLTGKAQATELFRTGIRGERDFFSGGAVPPAPDIARIVTVMVRHYYGELSYHEVAMGLK